MSILRIPINLSAIPAAERAQQTLRVAAQSGEETVSTVVRAAEGQTTVELEINAKGAVAIAIGPEQTSAADLFRRSTLTTTVRPTILGGALEYTVKPIIVTLPIWQLWLRWCRTFTITGRVVGADGSPVPSAQVSAFNVDWFWWWSSTGQVGSTVVTDPDGNFTIDFTWCCGWLPWYWWELREWWLDPFLVRKIEPILRLNPELHVNPPSPELGLSFSATTLAPVPRPRPVSAAVLQGPRPVTTAPLLNPTTLSEVRTKFLAVLPAVPEFVRFCLWPWCPWTPWLNCDPNIIFKVTQNCGGETSVIVNENVFDARIDIPTTLNVTLTANSDACTIPTQTGQPEGACFLFTGACGVDATGIGATGTGALAGLVSPDAEDRPFTGQLTIYGQFGYTAAELHYADYYGLQYRPASLSVPNTALWQAVPAAALMAFDRGYFDATQPYGSQWLYPEFAPQTMPLSGSPGTFVQAYMSRQFFELSNPTPPNDWGDVLNGQSWTSEADLTAVINTAGFLSNGGYEFQIVAYTRQPDGTLLANGAPAGCGKPNPLGINYNNDFTLFVANPVPGAVEPDAAINFVSINGVRLEACGIETLPTGVPFSFAVNFTASDAEGYLDSYALSLQWGTNAPVPLLSCGCSLATPATCGLSTAEAGVQVGPCYADAVSVAEGGTRPVWNGGVMTLMVADAQTLVHSTSCAYDLILTVYKRNIVNCNLEDVYQETVYHSFTLLFQ